MTIGLLTGGAVDAALADAGAGVRAVYEAIQQGEAELAAQCVGKLDRAERRSCGEVLKKLRAANRGVWSWEQRERLRALFVAGAGCQTGAAAAADWLASRDFRWADSSMEELLLRVLADRAHEWQADVARRLAQRPRSSGISYELMAGLVRLSGCAAPTTESYVHGWMFSLFRRPEGSLITRLRNDPDLTRLVAAFFLTPEVGTYTDQYTYPGVEGQNSWPEALELLTREGSLDRATMVGSCLARLLRGGRPMDDRMFLSLLDELAPTREEQLRHLADWSALASDGSSVVAGHAQAVLAGLALDGDLPDTRLSEISRAVLFRTEKKLVRAQLVLLGKVLRSRPEAAGELLPAVAEAFGHADTDIQERALKLVARHTDALDRMQLAELATTAELLAPGLRSRAAEILGQPIGDEDETPDTYEEFLPPVPEPVRTAPAGATPAEVAEDVSVLLAGAVSDMVTFERALDGLMRQAYRDREALREALLPVVQAQRWWDHTLQRISQDGTFPLHSSGIELMVAAVLGRLSTTYLHRHAQLAWSEGSRRRGGPVGVRDARYWEAAYRLHVDPAPFLLAAPTDSSGSLDPAVLLERLEEYARLGARVGETDFGQALLRVRFDSPADERELSAWAERAEAIGIPHGARLAEHLRAGAPAAPVSHRGLREFHNFDSVLVDLGELPWLQERFRGPFARMGRPATAADGNDAAVLHHKHLLAVVPGQPELLAARLLYAMAATALHDYPVTSGYLPALAEAPGPAGPAVHLSVAYGLALRKPQDRLEAVDALLVLAARGALDPARLGADIADLSALVHITPSRLADGLRTAAGTGAYATVWSVIRAALPALLTMERLPAKALGDFLEVGADCAERCGARGEIPELTERAARSGTSRVQSQTRRLHRTLGG
ncbi:hypothetical protein H9Y04_20175 [Streptomyces sp. TRM66268-LWL]|uniref:Secreted protein n=1 Tax=Streptomyces polyasparticus TaxID=2767826 RepID=A0ABR7SH82_9ACTN|nr:DUF6493 family protein [Streptomyces polyasparticus]MBC9714871.1 hypothetical protein [Streptomyces polyasparticus]